MHVGACQPLDSSWLSWESSRSCRYMPGIFKAASPRFAYLFLKHNPRSAWIALGSIALAFSGVEAMSADMGHFSRASISVSFSTCACHPLPQLIALSLSIFCVAKLISWPNLASTCSQSHGIPKILLFFKQFWRRW